jgi:hypothetical protein
MFRGRDPYAREPQTTIRNERFRSRSPLRRRSPSPYRSPPPPRPFATGSNATVVEPRQENRSMLFNDSRGQFDIPIPAPRAEPRPLGQITNVPRSAETATAKPPTAQAANTAVPRAQLPSRNEILVEDPYFVLGVSDGASEAE